MRHGYDGLGVSVSKENKIRLCFENGPNHLQRMARPAGGMARFGDKAFHSRGN
ncbi:hypothetical protein NXV14_23485 [Bacteroides fragilis]|nr:hypothetical protein [Bacteroides fragilis]